MTVSGIRVVGIPLLSNNPVFAENVLLGNTSTAKALSFAYIDEAEVVVTASTIGTTAIDPYALTTDYVIDETAGTITAKGSTTPNTTVKVTYTIQPFFILTHMDNIILGLNEEFRIGADYDLDTDTTLVVIRTKIDFLYQENEAVVLVKNIQDALITSKAV